MNWFGNEKAIPMKINNEVPLPMPLSVICSAMNRENNEPPIKIIGTTKYVVNFKVLGPYIGIISINGFSPEASDFESIITCGKAIKSVNIRVITLSFFYLMKFLLWLNLWIGGKILVL